MAPADKRNRASFIRYSDDRRHIVDSFNYASTIGEEDLEIYSGPNPDFDPALAGGKLDEAAMGELSRINNATQEKYQSNINRNNAKDLREAADFIENEKISTFNGGPTGRLPSRPEYAGLSKEFIERLEITGNSLQELAKAGLLYIKDPRDTDSPFQECRFYQANADQLGDTEKIRIVDAVYDALQNKLDKIAQANGAPYKLQEFIADKLTP